MLLENKTALITGAARGIGKAIAMKFAQEGANIAFTDLVIDEVALQTKQELEGFGVKVLAIASDASNFEAAHQVIEEVVAAFGQIANCNKGITKDVISYGANSVDVF